MKRERFQNCVATLSVVAALAGLANAQSASNPAFNPDAAINTSPEYNWTVLSYTAGTKVITPTVSGFPLSDARSIGGTGQSPWRPVPSFSDEFASGSSYDTTKWTGNLAPGTWTGTVVDSGNNTDTWTMDNSSSNITVSADTLKIGASLSAGGAGKVGWLQSNTRFLYGYFEVRMKAPNFQSHSNVFLHTYNFPVGVDVPINTELDIVETSMYGGASYLDKLNLTNHVWAVYAPAPVTATTSTLNATHWQVGPAPINWFQTAAGGTMHATDFHVYGIEWNRNSISYYLDGRLVMRGQNTHWHEPMYLLLTHEFGDSSFVGGKPVRGTSGNMEVDYVRVWDSAGNPMYPTTIK